MHGVQVSFVILQTVLKQEDTNQQESALKKDAEEFEQMVQLGMKRCKLYRGVTAFCVQHDAVGQCGHAYHSARSCICKCQFPH